MIKKEIFTLTFFLTLIIPENAVPIEKYDIHYFNKIIEEVNSAGAHWTAGHNFDKNVLDSSYFKNLLGSLQPTEDKLPLFKFNSNSSICSSNKDQKYKGTPQIFDVRKVWKHSCPSVSQIWNQGKCASDWVIASVSSITDRICIYNNGSSNNILSPEEPLACCKTCGWGCKKGYPSMVFKYWTQKGLVTGGAYHSKKGCQPYSIKPCKKSNQCATEKGETPACQRECSNSQYSKKYEDDKNKGEAAFRIHCPCRTSYEISKYGPLAATFEVYEDFLTYKSGIYHHVSGKKLGLLTVKLVGYNDEADPKYYIAANSWGKHWGNHGYFKIVRMQMECMIDRGIHGAYVKKPDDDENNSCITYY